MNVNVLTVWLVMGLTFPVLAQKQSIRAGAPGPKGDAGESATILHYRADANSTAANDPGAGKLRWNAADQLAATSLYIDWLTADGFDAHAVLALLNTPAGTRFFIQDTDLANIYQEWHLVETIPFPDWFEVRATLVSHGAGGLMANNKLCSVVLVLEGARGPPGPGIAGSARSLVVQNNSITPDSQIDVTAEAALLGDASGLTNYLAQTVNLTINMAATPGSVNALDTGSEAASTWYYAYLISDGTNVAGLFSASATAPTLPAGYIYKAMVSAVRNDASSNFVKMYQADRRCFLDQQVVFTARNAAVANTYEILAGADLTAFRAAVPPIAKLAHGNAGSSSGASAMAIAACSANGAVNTNSVGVSGSIGQAAGSVFDGFVMGSYLTVPVRGGVSYNIQWKAFNTSIASRLVITGFTF